MSDKRGVLSLFRELLCRHHYEAAECDTPGWKFEQCVKCGHLHTLRRPGSIVTICAKADKP